MSYVVSMGISMRRASLDERVHDAGRQRPRDAIDDIFVDFWCCCFVVVVVLGPGGIGGILSLSLFLAVGLIRCFCCRCCSTGVFSVFETENGVFVCRCHSGWVLEDRVFGIFVGKPQHH